MPRCDTFGSRARKKMRKRAAVGLVPNGATLASEPTRPLACARGGRRRGGSDCSSAVRPDSDEMGRQFERLNVSCWAGLVRVWLLTS